MRMIEIVKASDLAEEYSQCEFNIAAVLGGGYSKGLRPARNLTAEEIAFARGNLAEGGRGAILADNPKLGDNGQYTLDYVTRNGDGISTGINGWLENTVSGDTWFVFISTEIFRKHFKK